MNKPGRTDDGSSVLRPGGRPASAVWLDVTNVVDVKCVYLTGTTEVTDALIYNDAGKLVERKPVEGLRLTN